MKSISETLNRLKQKRDKLHEQLENNTETNSVGSYEKHDEEELPQVIMTEKGTNRKSSDKEESTTIQSNWKKKLFHDAKKKIKNLKKRFDKHGSSSESEVDEDERLSTQIDKEFVPEPAMSKQIIPNKQEQQMIQINKNIESLELQLAEQLAKLETLKFVERYPSEEAWLAQHESIIYSSPISPADNSSHRSTNDLFSKRSKHDSSPSFESESSFTLNRLDS